MAQYGIIFLASSFALYLLIHALMPDFLLYELGTFKAYVNARFGLGSSSLLNFLIVGGFSLIISVVAAGLFNRIYTGMEVYENAIKDNEFEKMLFSSIKKKMPVSISLKDNKVYIGWVANLNLKDTEERHYLKILPIVSGYRDMYTRRFKLTTWYTDVISAVEDSEHTSSISAEDFQIVFPASEITSVNLFDMYAYEQFQKSKKRPA
jgi:hypothetical protein